MSASLEKSRVCHLLKYSVMSHSVLYTACLTTHKNPAEIYKKK